MTTEWHCPHCGVTAPEWTMPFPHKGCAPGTVVEAREANPFNAENFPTLTRAYRAALIATNRADISSNQDHK